ncbi:hypothetical protein CVS40_7191 [Lucilia cuprina]|nr:hypothetical protein CVS40_7191 [Lucilia cuprina]
MAEGQRSDLPGHIQSHENLEEGNLPAQCRDDSTITRPSFSPLTALGNENSRLNNSAVFEVMEAAVGAAQSQMIQIMRNEMQIVVSEAVRVALSGSGNPSCNRSNVEWPHEMPQNENTNSNDNANNNVNEEVNCNVDRDFNQARNNGFSKFSLEK